MLTSETHCHWMLPGPAAGHKIQSRHMATLCPTKCSERGLGPAPRPQASYSGHMTPISAQRITLIGRENRRVTGMATGPRAPAC